MDHVKLIEKIQSYALENFQLDPFGIHGLSHWIGVQAFGRAILKGDRRDSQENLLLVDLFGLLHDVARFDDNRDPDHGIRAGIVVRMLDKLEDLSWEIVDNLARACETHISGKRPGNYIIGVCWDADRLDLSRFHWDLDQDLISTRTGKMIASDLTGKHPLYIDERRSFYGAGVQFAPAIRIE